MYAKEERIRSGRRISKELKVVTDEVDDPRRKRKTGGSWRAIIDRQITREPTTASHSRHHLPFDPDSGTFSPC